MRLRGRWLSKIDTTNRNHLLRYQSNCMWRIMWRDGPTPNQQSCQPRGSGFRLKLLLLFLAPAAAIAQPAPDDGEWTMPARNYQGTRNSGLNQINTTNAKTLKVAWTFSTGLT